MAYSRVLYKKPIYNISTASTFSVDHIHTIELPISIDVQYTWTLAIKQDIEGDAARV